jgi:signal transduction histidine kinase
MVATHSVIGVSERALGRRTRHVIVPFRGARLAVLLAWFPVLILGLLATVDAFGLGGDFAVVAWASGLLMIGLTLVAGLSDLRAAEARTGAALGRAVAAETAERGRADELAAILLASESLTLMNEGKLDFTGILAALTPAGATSFLVRHEGKESVVVAAHGPLAPWLIGVRKALPTGDGAETSRTAQITSYSASGHVVGTALVPTHLSGVANGVEAALGVSLTHGGRSLGWLYLLDPTGERILEPTFIHLAQLVANQIDVAIENQALFGRVQHQLSEVQRVQQQLVQATKLGAIGELAAAVAHEVNNPLTGILGFSELLLAELPGDDPRHQEASIIRAEAVRARSIIRALLEFARPRPPQRIPTDLNELARSTLELVRFRAGEAGIRIVEEYGDLPCLEIDPDAFRQVLLNLLNNAVDAMPGGGELRVATRLVDDRVSLVVADSGIGMDARTRSRIFTPFFSTRSGTGGGTGLGLSVSLQIVEGHGGSIDVESEPGRGAVFTVWLPASWPAFDGAVIVPGMDWSTSDHTGAATEAEESDVHLAPCLNASDSGPGQHRGAAA